MSHSATRNVILPGLRVAENRFISYFALCRDGPVNVTVEIVPPVYPMDQDQSDPVRVDVNDSAAGFLEVRRSGWLPMTAVQRVARAGESTPAWGRFSLTVACGNVTPPWRATPQNPAAFVLHRSSFLLRPARDASFDVIFTIFVPIVPPETVTAVSWARVVTAIGLPNLAMQQSGTLAGIALLQCEFRDDDKLEASDSPFAWSIDPSAGSAFRGAMATYLLFLLLIACAVIAACIAVVSRRNVSYFHALGILHLPSQLAVIIPLAAPSVALAATALTFVGTPADLALVAFGAMLLCAALAGPTVVLASDRFFLAMLITGREQSTDPPRDLPKPLLRLLGALDAVAIALRLDPPTNEEWVAVASAGDAQMHKDDNPSASFTSRWGNFFDDVRPESRWWFQVDVAYSVACAVTRGTRPASNAGCTTAMLVLLTVLVSYLGLFLWRRPFRALGMNIVAAGGQFLIVIGTGFMFVAQATRQSTTSLAIAGGWICCISGLGCGAVSTVMLLRTVLRLAPVLSRFLRHLSSGSGDSPLGKAQRFQSFLVDELDESMAPKTPLRNEDGEGNDDPLGGHQATKPPNSTRAQRRRILRGTDSDDDDEVDAGGDGALQHDRRRRTRRTGMINPFAEAYGDGGESEDDDGDESEDDDDEPHTPEASAGEAVALRQRLLFGDDAATSGVASEVSAADAVALRPFAAIGPSLRRLTAAERGIEL